MGFQGRVSKSALLEFNHKSVKKAIVSKNIYPPGVGEVKIIKGVGVSNSRVGGRILKITHCLSGLLCR